MHTPYLEITTKQAQLGINYYQPVMKIKQSQADVSMHQPPAKLTISHEASRLFIDQSEARADLDNKGAGRRVAEAAEQAKMTALTGISRRVREGDAMMKIENGAGAIPQIAKQNSEPNQKTPGIGYLPKNHFRVQIDYDPGNVDVNVTPQTPAIDVSINRPQIAHENWQAQIYLQQKEAINFELRDFQVDQLI